LLEETPPSLDDLYRQMLARREPMAKREGNKMLLLATNDRRIWSFNALAYSWLDKLEDSYFPLSHNLSYYPQSEIERQIGLVRESLSDGTAGLLEIRKKLKRYVHERKDNHPFFGILWSLCTGW
jgi:hypothetical protein